jgi:hypothetical protein
MVVDRAQIVPRSRHRVPRAGQFGGPPFSFAASSAVGFDLKRDPARHAMEPTAERIVDPECPGLAGQEQKGGLKRIVGVIGVSEDAAANGHDHRTMPLYECFESQLIALTGILLQERDIGQLRQSAVAEEPVHVPQRGPEMHSSHVAAPVTLGSLPIIRAACGESARGFYGNLGFPEEEVCCKKSSASQVPSSEFHERCTVSAWEPGRSGAWQSLLDQTLGRKHSLSARRGSIHEPDKQFPRPGPVGHG